MKIAIVDTTFSRLNMGEIAINELKKHYPNVEYTRKTVPGFKDLAVECKQLLEKDHDIALALGHVGSAEIDAQCAHEASLGIQMAKMLTTKHIIEVFVHENEANTQEEFESICINRIKKHLHNAIKIVLDPSSLVKNAGKGLRQGKGDEGSSSKNEDIPTIALIASNYHEEITKNMLNAAKSKAEELNMIIAKTVTVPGTFDSPLIVKKYLENKRIHGIAIIGFIEKGETLHGSVIGSSTANVFLNLSLKYNKPISLGVIGPGATHDQAKIRWERFAKNAIKAVYNSIMILRE